MKLLIIGKISDPIYRGYDGANAINQQVWLINKGLTDLGHEVTVVCREGSDIKDMINITSATEIAASNEYAEMIKKEKYDCVLDYSDEKWIYKVINLLKLKAIFMVYSTQAYNSPPPIKYPCFVSNSKYASMRLSAQIGSPVKTLPYCIDTTVAFGRENKAKDYLLYFGRIAKDRGVHEFIDMVRQTGNKAMIAGDDINVEQTYVKSIMDKCDGELITYNGNVSEKTKFEMISNAKALVIPYLSDYDAGSCDTAKVATYLGTLVITTNKGATKEFLEPLKNAVILDSAEEITKMLKFRYTRVFKEMTDIKFDVRFSIDSTSRALVDLIKKRIKKPW